MKKAKKSIALFLAFLMSLSLLPGSVLAEAAEEAYTLLCEPNIVGGFEIKTYSNVAAVWEKIYYDPVSGQIFEGVKANKDKGSWKPMHLMAADGSGVHAVSNWYQKITGLSNSGFAAAQNFDGKWGVINASGNVVVDCIYERASMPIDDGYVWVRDDNHKEFIIDLNNGAVYTLSEFEQTRGVSLSWTSDSFCFYDKALYTSLSQQYGYGGLSVPANGYIVVEDKNSDLENNRNIIVDTNGTVIFSDEGKDYVINDRGNPIVSKEGLIRVNETTQQDGERFKRLGYINLQGELVIPFEYTYADDFYNGYARVLTHNRDECLIDSTGNIVTPTISYGSISNASNAGVIWCENYGIITDVYQVKPCNSGNYTVLKSSSEYTYNAPDTGKNIALPTELLDTVTDTRTAVKAVTSLVNIMTNEQKTSPTSIDLATLFAETATAKAASRVIEGNDILIDASGIAELGNIASRTNEAVETALENGGVTAVRYLSNTVTLITDKSDITISIDPDVLTTEVDKVRVETPGYALTFKLADLAPDLTQTLTLSAKSASAGSTAPSTSVSSFNGNEGGQAFAAISMSILANAAVSAVEIDIPGGKTTNSITVSLPSDSGDTTYQAVASADGAATASKYNPATAQMDGKVNMSGKYTVVTNEKDFTDISNKSKEMQVAIRYLASKGIISGTTATTFNPDGSINRAEIATLLVKALGKLDTSATTSFSDVTKGNWYYSAAASSQKHGLINGFEDNTFRGTTSINKVQIVAVSSRVLTSEMNYKAPSNPSAYLSKYKDTVANWAQSEVALATRENLVVYRTDGTFSGDKNMTRGDAAIIIYRLFQRIW